MFLEILTSSLKLLKKNLNLAQLIFIFFIVVTIFTPVISGTRLNIKILPTIIIFYGVICAFFSGLFFAFKKAIDYETNPPQNANSLVDLPPLYFAEFFQGIGYCIKKFIFAGLLVILLLCVFGFAYDYILHHYAVIPERLQNLNSVIFLDDKQLMEFINSLSLQEKTKIGKISALTLFTAALWGLLTMLYPVILVAKEENFFKSFITSIYLLFKNIFTSTMLFLFFNICLTFAAIINFAAASNILIAIIAILLQCYLNVWYILALFVYYEKTK